MRILVVEDSEKLRRSICIGLRKSGYAVDEASDGTNGLWQAQSAEYDVLVLDVMLPGMDGLALLKRLRQQHNDVHVLMLTARDTIDDRVKGLRGGADDYLVKPFAFEELVARIEALVRRKHGSKNPVIELGDLRIDRAGRRVTRDAMEIELSPREFGLLEYLVARRGEVVTRTDIEAHLYDDRAELMSNVVDSAVCALRRKIDRDGEPSLIQTRRGFGYVLGAGEPDP